MLLFKTTGKSPLRAAASAVEKSPVCTPGPVEYSTLEGAGSLALATGPIFTLKNCFLVEEVWEKGSYPECPIT